MTEPAKAFGEIDLDLEEESCASFGRARTTSSIVIKESGAIGGDADVTQLAGWQDAPRMASRSCPAPSTADERVSTIRDLYVRGNTDAALALASEMVAEVAAGDRGLEETLAPQASTNERTAIACAGAVPRLARLTSARSLRLRMTVSEMLKLPVDPRTVFLVGQIEAGVQSMADLLDVCAMPEAEALELVEELCCLGILALD